MDFRIEQSNSYSINRDGVKAYFNSATPFEVMISNDYEPHFYTKKEAEIILEFLNHLQCEGWLEG